jgi:hypothetical protein
MLRVENTNILSSRKFRNYFEHYDEQIDDWFKHQTSAVYTDLAMNPSLQGLSLPETTAAIIRLIIP